jgi:hypothetical protein
MKGKGGVSSSGVTLLLSVIEVCLLFQNFLRGVWRLVGKGLGAITSLSALKKDDNTSLPP